MTTAVVSDAISGGEASSDRMEECCVSLNTYSDDDVDHPRHRHADFDAATASPNLSDDTSGDKEAIGDRHSSEGEAEARLPGESDDWEIASARDGAISSRLVNGRFSAGPAGASRSRLGNLSATNRRGGGEVRVFVGEEFSRLGQKQKSKKIVAVAVGEDFPLSAATSAADAVKRKAAAVVSAAPDRCDSLSRIVRQKVAPVTVHHRGNGKNVTATVVTTTTTTTVSSDDQNSLDRAPSEELSDTTAKPVTPDPDPAPAATAEVLQQHGESSAVDTAAAIKGVLEGLALDGSAGEDHVDVPDGVLAVPLLRHQRRALSWMRQREAKGSTPRGGLLADDQGLGKTFSTIALIVSSPPPSRAARLRSRRAGARPLGGTLVACPTSVLRQWQRELASKVTAATGLKVLVHHGVGRTKSAMELAEYDVVLTTFAVVGLEVAVTTMTLKKLVP